MTDTLQDQLNATRRNHILDAAAQVFAEKGFHSATIRDIARAAGVADGTIYNYFDNKTALLLGIFDRMRASVQPTIHPANIADMPMRDVIRDVLWQPLTALRTDNFGLFRIIVAEMLVNPDMRALYTERILTPTLAIADALFDQWIAQGHIAPTHPRLTVRVVAGMVLGLMLEHIMGDETLVAEWDALPDVLTDLLLNGLTTKGDQA